MKTPIALLVLILVAALAGCSEGPDETGNAGPAAQPSAPSGQPQPSSPAPSTPAPSHDCINDWDDRYCGQQADPPTQAGPSSYPASTDATWSFESQFGCKGTFEVVPMDSDPTLKELADYNEEYTPDQVITAMKFEIDFSQPTANDPNMSCMANGVVLTHEDYTVTESVSIEDLANWGGPEDAEIVNMFIGPDTGLGATPGAKGHDFALFDQELKPFSMAAVDLHGGGQMVYATQEG